MQFAPDGRLFVAEQCGKLRVIKNGSLLSAAFVTLSTDCSGERGLLGVAFDPAFATNRFVYLYYTATSPTVHNRISRFTANGDVAVAGSEVAIFDLDNLSSATNHNGGALGFGPDGKLYAAVGENNNSANSQSLSTVLGKILRLNTDGTAPADNPFFGSTSGKNRAIWALGLRNPFTFAFNPLGAELFINDVGETTWEEINDGLAGANYGWPTTEGSTANPNFKSPRLAYVHASGVCAITGGAFYSPLANQFPSDYVNDYFFADYCAGWIRKLDPAAGNSVTTFATGISSPVDVKVSDDGSLYYLARGNGAVFRIQYGASGPTITSHPMSQSVAPGASVTFSVRASGSPPLRYQWLRNGVNIPGATAQDYTIASVVAADNGATFRANVSNDFDTTGVLSNQATLTVSSNQAPTGTISQPASGTLYSGGTVINYAGTGTDPQDGTLPASAFTWQVDFHHDTHVHPFMPATTGAMSGSFTIPTVGETSANVWYRIYLTVRDSGGLTHTTQRDIFPRKVVLTLASNPSGLQLKLDGQPTAAPLSFDAVVGMVRTIEATTPQASGPTTYTFTSWSDGGAANHTISTPATNTTYTATYQGSGSTAPPIARIQNAGKDAGTTASTTLAFPSTNTAGNLIAVVVRAGGINQVFTVTDTSGNLYRKAVQFNVTLDNVTLAVFYAENINGGANTVQVSSGQSGTLRLGILEYSGAATTNSLDVTAASQGTSAAPTSGNATTTANGDLLIGVFSTADPTTVTPGTGFTLCSAVPANPNAKLAVEDRVQSAAGSAAAAASLGATTDWGSVFAAFRPGAAPSGVPGMPGSPNPSNGATGISTTPSLSWTSTGATSYDVSFGTSNPPPVVASNLTIATYTPPALANGTQYFWRIVARNGAGTITGAVWSFTTAASSLPGVPTSPNPASGATGVSTTASLSWTATGATSYDVSFGTTNPPPTAASNLTTATYTPPALANGTQYFWRIVARNGAGTTTGAVWSFTTSAPLALIQQAGKDAGTTASTTLAFPSSNAAGNWIGVAVRAGGTNQVITITDTRGNLYRKAVQFNATLDNVTLAIFYAENIGGGANTIQVSDSQSGTLRLSILEYAGVATTNSLDVTAAAQGTSAAPASGNAATTGNGELLIGVVMTADFVSVAAGSGYTLRDVLPANPSAKLAVEDRVQTTAGSAAATASLGAATNWGAVLASFRARP